MPEENLKYDVFISYRWVWPDRRWVRKHLVPGLRAAGLKVWLDVEHIHEPASLYHEGKEAINNSRLILCVISPAYSRQTRKPASWAGYEFKLLLGRTDRVVPLVLRGAIPDGIRDRKSFNWFYPRKVAREWKTLLTALKAATPDAAVPRVLILYVHFILVWFLRSFLALLLTFSMLWVLIWLSNGKPPPPSPQVSITTVNGQAARYDMTVAPSGSIAGEVNMEVHPSLQVFVYLQRKGGDYDELWECAGTSRITGRGWSLSNIDFRLLLNPRATKATLRPFLQSDDKPCQSLHDSDFAELTKGNRTSSTPLVVNVPAPAVTIDEAELTVAQTFAAAGTIQNTLEEKEDLCAWLEVRRNTNAAFSQCFRPTTSGGKWKVANRLKAQFKFGDTYRVEVGLVSKTFDGEFRPNDFFVLASTQETGWHIELLRSMLSDK